MLTNHQWCLVAFAGRQFGQVEDCCMTAPSHYLNRCWLIITEVLWHSPDGNYTGNAQGIGPWHKSHDLRLHPHLPQQMSSWRNQSSSPSLSLQQCRDERDGVSNDRLLVCLSNRLFKRRSKKTSKLRVTGLCEGNPPVTDGFPSQRASNGEHVSIWWSHHDIFIPIFFVQFTDKCLNLCHQIL